MATTITADLVKTLRDRTGAGMMECKAALTEASGNFEDATLILRKRGLASAAKKAGRMMTEGLIGHRVSPDHRNGILVEVNCESDFVARTPDFQQLVEDVITEIERAIVERIDQVDSFVRAARGYVDFSEDIFAPGADEEPAVPPAEWARTWRR